MAGGGNVRWKYETKKRVSRTVQYLQTPQESLPSTVHLRQERRAKIQYKYLQKVVIDHEK